MVQVYVASAFSKDDQGGNKAGVVLERPDLTPEEQMYIAKELGYSETAFVTKSDVADFELQYFTPTEEVPLCGHATIATFSVLYHLGKLKPSDYLIKTKAGILKIKIEADGMIFMEQNRPTYYEIMEANDFNACIKKTNIDTSLPIQMVSTGLKDIILPINSVSDLAEIYPCFDKISDLSKEKDAVGIHAFALVQGSDITAICRNFAPLYGIDEESATGTASCALACYLFKHYEKKDRYVFEQGYNLNSISKIIVNLKYHETYIDSVFVGGYGYMVKNISIEIPKENCG